MKQIILYHCSHFSKNVHSKSKVVSIFTDIIKILYNVIIWHFLYHIHQVCVKVYNVLFDQQYTIIILQRLRRTFYQANFLFSNGPNSTSFSFIFVFFKQTLQSLQQIYVKKCDDHPVYSAGIRTHNLQPSSSHSYTFEAQPKLSSCCSCQTAWWRPACCLLGWGSMSIGDPSKSRRES